MFEKRPPLSRSQLRSIQIVRGISAEELQHRSGMPRASYDAIFGASTGDEGKNAAKLMAMATFDRLVALLGIDKEYTSLRRTGVIEWRAEGTDKVTSPNWLEALPQLGVDMFSDSLSIVEVSQEGAKKGRFGRPTGVERMVLLHDRIHNYRIAITEAPEDLVAQLERVFIGTCERRLEITAAEFHPAREMIRHDTFKSVQFDALSGAINPTYNWRDVQAAAREFGFLPDDLIELMHAKAKERSEQNRPEGNNWGDQSGASNNTDEEEYRVSDLHLRLVAS
jgi:hypothetical protein